MEVSLATEKKAKYSPFPDEFPEFPEFPKLGM